MPRFTDLPDDFICPYRQGCPYLEGLSTAWVWRRYQEVVGTECDYEHIIRQLHQELDQAHFRARDQEREIQQLKAQLQALHRRQFKGRKTASATAPATPAAAPKKRGPPQGHPPWLRPKPRQIDRIIPVAAPRCCPHCQSTRLTPVPQIHQHLQEDIVLEPRVVTTCFVHQQAHCSQCGRDVLRPGPGELLGSYLEPVPKGGGA
jgi:hypothetical protein